MATSAGAVVAAAAARARREVREHFENAGAFNPGHAVSYQPPSYLHERQFDLLVGRGILREAGTGRFWINREAVELEAQRRRRAAKILFFIMLVGLVIAAGISMVLTRVG